MAKELENVAGSSNLFPCYSFFFFLFLFLIFLFVISSALIHSTTYPSPLTGRAQFSPLSLYSTRSLLSIRTPPPHNPPLLLLLFLLSFQFSNRDRWAGDGAQTRLLHVQLDASSVFSSFPFFFFARSECCWLMMLARWTVFGHPRFGLKHWRRGIKSNKAALHITIDDDEEEPWNKKIGMLFPSTYNCPLVESIDKAMSKMWNVYIKVWHQEFRVSFRSDLNIFLVFLVFFGFSVFRFLMLWSRRQANGRLMATE